MDLLKKELGRRLSSQDVASWLGLDVKTIRRYYESLGGVRIGERRIIFFERSILNAIQKQTKSKETVDGAGEAERQKNIASPSRQKKKP